MKHALGALLALFLLSALAGAGNWVNLTASTQPTSVQCLEAEAGRIVLTSQINGFYRDDLTINGSTFQFISLPEASYQWEKGNPELPRLCRSVIIPDHGHMAVRILASEYRDVPNLSVAPSKGHLLRSVDPADVPFEFGPIYQQDAWYPENILTLREPYILRDLRGQVVEINAFQYNPARRTLRVYTNLTFEVYQAGSGGENEFNRTAPMVKFDRTFKQIYQRHFLNFNPLDYTPVEEVGPMLVITYDLFYSTVQPLVDWKNQKGIPTTLVPISQIGNNSTAIRDYIRNLYQTTGLTFVLIVGDQAQVTSWMLGSLGGDPMYSELVGSDHYPELFVGRFSAETIAQAATQVERTIFYEKTPMTTATWYQQGTGIASSQGAGIGHYGEADWQHMNLIRSDLLRYGYTLVDQIYDPGATAAQVTTALNAGRGILNYCGHGSTTSWGTTNFNNGNVNALVNDNMLHFGTTVACLCGNFTGTTCFAEAWLRATHNGAPTGAIGFYTSSQSQSWAPPMYAQDEFVDLMCADDFHSYGALCFNGAMEMIDQTGSTGNSEFDHWHVFGDPSFQVRTYTPTTLTATHAGTVDYLQSTFQVTVPNTPGALAALSAAGILLGSGYTDSTGQVTFNLTWQPLGAVATVTVTSYNRIPYIAAIPIVGGFAPQIDISLTPNFPPIQIPAAGGSFDFTVSMVNNAGAFYAFDAWISQLLPNGQWQGPMLGPFSLSLSASGYITRVRTQNVPGSALPGTYTYCGYVGDYPGVKWDSSSFTYTKLGAGFDQPGHDTWANTGEPFEGELIAAPESYALRVSVAPNPFNPTTDIRFQIPDARHVSLRIYDTAGRLVATLVDGWREAGTHQVTFDGARLGSGVYLYTLKADGYTASGKMALVK